MNLRQMQIPTRSLVCNKTGSEQKLLFFFTLHTSWGSSCPTVFVCLENGIQFKGFFFYKAMYDAVILSCKL